MGKRWLMATTSRANGAGATMPQALPEAERKEEPTA